MQAQLRVAGEYTKPIPLRINFTEAVVTRLSGRPGKRQTWYHDIKQRGLTLLVTNNGAKCFYVYRKLGGRPVRLRLGDPATLTVEQARKLAIGAHAQMNEGINPVEERKEERIRNAAAISLGTLWKNYVDGWLNVKAKHRTIISDKSRYKTCLETWKDRRVDGITADDCRALHAAIEKKRGAPTADKALKLMRRMFNWARISPNPCGGKEIRWFVGKNEDQRDRYLTADELVRFHKALDAEPDETQRDFIKLLLLVGQRRTNTAAMRWDNLDLTAGIWRIPGAQHKSKTDILIPLSAEAVALLKERRESQQRIAKAGRVEPSEYVLPNHRRNPKVPHVTEGRYALERMCKAAKIDDLTLHDLRRTLGVHQALNGASELVIGASLGHRDREATRRYSQIANLAVVRASVQRANDAILGKSPEPEQSRRKGGKTKK